MERLFLLHTLFHFHRIFINGSLDLITDYWNVAALRVICAFKFDSVHYNPLRVSHIIGYVSLLPVLEAHLPHRSPQHRRSRGCVSRCFSLSRTLPLGLPMFSLYSHYLISPFFRGKPVRDVPLSATTKALHYAGWSVNNIIQVVHFHILCQIQILVVVFQNGSY